MSNFTNDSSTQLSYTPAISFSYNTISTPEVNFNGTSGIYNPSNNVIKMFTNKIDAHLQLIQTNVYMVMVQV